MKTLAPSRQAYVSSLADVLDALAVSADPCQFLPALLAETIHSEHRAYLEITCHGLQFPEFRVRRLILPQRPDNIILDEPACEGGTLAELIKVPAPKIIHDLDLQDDSGIPPALRACRSAMAVPMRVGDSAMDWVVLLDHRPDAFTPAELEEMVVRTRLVAITLENLQVAQQLCASNLRIKQDIDEIGELQRSLLPESLPEIPGLRLAASYEAYSLAGGDIYDMIPLGHRPGHPESEGDERWAILIGDVSGHGPAAAVVMAMLHAIVHTFPNSPTDPAQVLAYANRQLCAKNLKGAFVTAILAFYEPSTRTITYCRAGHPPLVLTDWTSPPVHQHLEEVGDIPLGVDADAVFSCGQIRLQPGQTLLLYTDGITEARNQAGRQLDLDGLELAIAGGEGNARRIVSSILASLEWHDRGMAMNDDRTLVAIEAV
jgi:phosphoserine phosphatase RsbU/P